MKDLSTIFEGKANKVLVTVFPHPDDETMMTGGVIMKAKSLGYKTIIISLTAGGAGKIHVNAKGKSLKEVRRAELAKAARVLKADQIIVGDFEDGRLRQTQTKWKKWVKEKIELIKPGIVITYDPSGFYGHPDHIALSKYLLDIFRESSNFQLIWVAVPDEFKNSGVLRGMTEVVKYMQEPTHILDLGWGWYTKWRAACAHKSQSPGKDIPVPLWLFMAVKHYEWYHVLSRNSVKNSEYRFGYIDYEL